MQALDWQRAGGCYERRMDVTLSRRALLAGLGASVLVAPGRASEPELEVPFVPTPHALVQRMLDLAQVGPNDYLIDLGCGDGRIAVAAARRGARALGVDLSPLRLQEAAAAARLAGVEAHTVFRRQDLFRTPIFEASVVALYLLPAINLRLRPTLLTELRPGSRVISHAFDMGDWRPEANETLDGRRIFLWVIPAIAGGSWALTGPDGSIHALEIEQRFQEISGTLAGLAGMFELSDAVLRGTSIAFRAGAQSYRGTVDNAAMRGEGGWSARRLA
jgi:SAM-dependent methyltransferase